MVPWWFRWQEDPPEKGMATHSTLAWTEEPTGLQRTGREELDPSAQLTPSLSCGMWTVDHCKKLFPTTYEIQNPLGQILYIDFNPNNLLQWIEKPYITKCFTIRFLTKYYFALEKVILQENVTYANM